MVLALLFLLLQDSFPVTSIRVQGNSRFSSEAIVRASGLSVSQPAAAKDFAAACNRLIDTGLISSAKYQYRPSASNGFDLTLIVTEVTDLYDVHIDVPGIDEARVWDWMSRNEPLVQSRGPTSTAALEFYERAIERFLAAEGKPQDVTARLRTDPQTASVVVIFRPSSLGRISAVRFEGNSAIPGSVLERAIAPAVGSEYTDADFRETLDLNVRPLYEEQGRYALRYKRIAVEGGTVTVALEEGPVFRLGAVQVAGEKLPVPAEELAGLVRVPEGEPPNWKKIAAGAAAIEAALGRFGYLDANVQADRHLDESAGRIDVILSVEKGPQYRFGGLKLEGLEPPSEARARSLWKIAPGEVIRLDYLDTYEKQLMRDDRIRFKRISRKYAARPDASGIADVTFTFRQ